MTNENQTKYQLLPHCTTNASELIIVASCDGASTVGQNMKRSS
jgi:hypothetical protein